MTPGDCKSPWHIFRTKTQTLRVHLDTGYAGGSSFGDNLGSDRRVKLGTGQGEESEIDDETYEERHLIMNIWIKFVKLGFIFQSL